MEMTQINTRIPLELKQKGDEVLARHKVSTSDVIRALWVYMTGKQQLPSFMYAEEQERNSSFEEKCAEIERGASLLTNYYHKLGLQNPCSACCSREELRELAYQDMVSEYEAL